jgi:N-acetylglucosaminyl-diphospho-decaprenol L-rhamnosyltransferase
MRDSAERVTSLKSLEPGRATADIVIVNWNSGHLLARCVASILDHGENRAGSVVVVDNGSTDGSDMLSYCNPSLEIVRTGLNLGFGRACNLGARMGRSRYVLFLNPDAALLPKTLSVAVDFMERPENARIGVCGAKLIEEDGTVQRHCARLPTLVTFLAAASGLATALSSRVPTLHERGFDHLTSRPVDHVIGAFYLIRRVLFEQLAGFDEEFFVYLEDLDLSARVHAAGYSVYYLAEAVGLHKGGGSSEQVKPQRLAYSLESRIIYSFKHFNAVSAVIVAAATLLVEPLPRLVRAIARGSFTEARDTVSGVALLWRRTLVRLRHRYFRVRSSRT